LSLRCLAQFFLLEDVLDGLLVVVVWPMVESAKAVRRARFRARAASA